MNNNIDEFCSAMKASGFVVPDIIEPGKTHRFPTHSQRTEPSGWCQIFLDGQAGVFGDFRTGLSTHWFGRQTNAPTPALRQQRAIDLQKIRAEVASVQAVRSARAQATNTALWDQALPIEAHDPVARYLAGRHIHLAAWPQALRCHPGLDYWQDGQCLGRFPVMLGEVTDTTGQRISLHRTYLTANGAKANVQVVKKLTASSAPLVGCSVKLASPKLIKGRMTQGMAEGIETALACTAASGTPTVAAISAQGKRWMRWSCLAEDVDRLIVFADNDSNQVGQEAAASLTQSLKRRGRIIRVLTPPEVGTDWADVWAAQAKGL